MVVTRGKSGVATQPKKTKFVDGDVSINEYHTADEEDNYSFKSSISADDSEESDSDEAPEETSTSVSRKNVISQQKELEKLKQEEKKNQKEKRRQLDLKYKQQQEGKKKHEEKKQPEQPELPEFLDESLFDEFEKEEEVVVKPKHLKVADFEELTKQQLDRALKEEKLKELRKRKRGTVKKGPVNVRVQSLDSVKKVPVAEAKIMNSKYKWLKRKSLNRR